MLGMASTVFVFATTTVVFGVVSVSTATDVTVRVQAMLMCQADPLLTRQRQHNGKNCDGLRLHTRRDRSFTLGVATAAIANAPRIQAIVRL